MHRALSSLAWVFIVLPGCGDAPSAEPLGGGHGGSGGVVDPETSGDVAGSDGSEGSTSDGSAGDASAGGSAAESSSGGLEAICGDGIVDADEACDDGNGVGGDGCELDCTQSVGVAAFSVGGAHACAVSFEGEVRCWGDNFFGQLGIGSTEVIGDDESPLSAGRSVPLPAIDQVAAGLHHTCALSVERRVYCWGDNASGQLGLGHDKPWGDEVGEEPIALDLGGPVAEISAGAAHSCARLLDGAVRCWGSGAAGQLGHGDGFDGTVGAGEAPYPDILDAPAVDLGEDAAVRELSGGRGDHTCAVDATGEAYCWGAGADGQLGTADNKPVGTDLSPLEFGQVTAGESVRSVAVGGRHSCALTSAWGLLCFGLNDAGQLGLGHTDAIGDDEAVDAVRVELDAPTVVAVTATDRSTCALSNDGTVRCWGDGSLGALGYGSPDTVGDDELPADWDGFGALKLFTAVTAIDAGSEHVCARTDDAWLRCWGRADGGRLGAGIPSLDAYGDDAGELEPPVVRVFR